MIADPHNTRSPASQKAGAPNVLVAEDNATNRLLIARMLERYGCTVTLVTTGLEAIEAVSDDDRAAFDIILMDIQMPELDGRAATRIIRAREAAHPGARPIPIVALTANDMPEDIADYLAAGMTAHLPKPIDWPKLLALIDALARLGEAVTSPS